MKRERISCDVIQDLLPLYEDNCCSEHSRKLVEDHLKECVSCGKKYNEYMKELPENMDLEAGIEAKQIRQGIQNIIRWKKAGIAVLCIVVATFFIVIPFCNHITGEGITYENLKAVQTAYGFEKALASGNYEKAYTYLDIEGKYQDLLETNSTNLKVMEGIHEIEKKGFEWYNEVAKTKFMENMKKLEEMNEVVDSYSGFHILKQSYGWTVDFNYVQTASEQEIGMQLDISPDGITNFNVLVKFVPIDSVTGGMTMNEAVEQKNLMLSRFYVSPTINESVMEILYDETDYDWEKLFIY